jgi:hypothetical protein
MPEIPNDWETLPSSRGIAATESFVVEGGQHRLMACEKLFASWVPVMSPHQQALENWWVAEVYNSDTLSAYDLALVRVNPATVVLPDSPGRQYLQQSRLLAAAQTLEERNKIFANLVGVSSLDEPDRGVSRQSERVKRLMDSPYHAPLLSILQFPGYCDTFKSSQFDKVLAASPTSGSFNRWPWYARTKLEEQSGFWVHALGLAPHCDTQSRRSQLKLSNAVTSQVLKAVSTCAVPRNSQDLERKLTGATRKSKGRSAAELASLLGDLEAGDFGAFIERACSSSYRQTQIVSSMSEFGSWTSKQMKCANHLSYHLISWISPKHLKSHDGPPQDFTLEGSLELFLGRATEAGEVLGLRLKPASVRLTDFYVALRQLVEGYFEIFQTHVCYYVQETLDDGSWETYLERFAESEAWLRLAFLVEEWFEVREEHDDARPTTPFGNWAMKKWSQSQTGRAVDRKCTIDRLDGFWKKPLSNNLALATTEKREELEAEIRRTILRWQLKHTVQYLEDRHTNLGDFPSLTAKNEWLSRTVDIYRAELTGMAAGRGVNTDVHSMSNLPPRTPETTAAGVTKGPRKGAKKTLSGRGQVNSECSGGLFEAFRGALNNFH